MAISQRKLQNRYNQQQEQRISNKQIIYENRIFHIKKKYSVALKEQSFDNLTQLKYKNKISFTSRIKPKPSELFSKYCDSIEKHKLLIRKGTCDLPLKIEMSQQKKPKQQKHQNTAHKLMKLQKKTLKTQIVEREQDKIKSIRTILQSNRQRFNDYSARSNDKINDLKNWNKRFYTNGNADMPKTKKNYYFQSQIKNKNNINNKLTLEMIHYSLLGQWTKQSLIF